MHIKHSSFSRQLVALIFISLCGVTVAGEPLSILGYTKSTSFWVGLPTGWRSDADAAKQTGAMFVLVPSSFTFDTAPAVIVASTYENSSLAAAMSKDRSSFLQDDPGILVADGKPVVSKSGAQFSVREFRSQRLQQQGYESVAYHAQAPDVVVLTLSAQTEAQFRDGKVVFGTLLRTFETAKLKVRQAP